LFVPFSEEATKRRDQKELIKKKESIGSIENKQVDKAHNHLSHMIIILVFANEMKEITISFFLCQNHGKFHQVHDGQQQQGEKRAKRKIHFPRPPKRESREKVK
jgi:hypothetical protein